MNSCRLCMQKGNTQLVTSIFENAINDLPEKIENCVSIKITPTDQFPTTVCVTCIKQVIQWSKFKEDCLKTQNLLILTINSKIGDETLQIGEETSQIVKKTSQIVIKTSQNVRETSQIVKETLKLQPEIVSATINTNKLTQLEEQKAKPPVDSEDSDYEIEDLGDCLNLTDKLSSYIYKCELCQCEFSTCFEYLDHQLEHDGAKIFKCDKCSEVFCSRGELVKHDRNHKIACLQCGKVVKERNMKIHVVQHTNKYCCQLCPTNRFFNSPFTLHSHHLATHTRTRDHVCDTCGKCFSLAASLRVHQLTHSEVRGYSCPVGGCSYAGRTASALSVHHATHMVLADGGGDGVKCDVCDKVFKSVRNWRDHKRRAHAKERRHRCGYCEKRFVDESMLKVHVRSHTGVRPYKCQLCDKTFIRKDALKEHMTTHGKRTLFECKKCAKTFTNNRSVKRHNCIAIF